MRNVRVLKLSDTDVHPIITPQLNVIPKKSCGQCVILFMNGYMTIRIKDDSPMNMVIVLREIRIHKLKNNRRISKNIASGSDMLSFASGLFFVRSTFASILRSTISLKMQPADLMRIEPRKKSTMILISIICCEYIEDEMIPYKHGINNKSQPIGLLFLVIAM